MFFKGTGGGLTYRMLEKLTRRNRFSDYLPYAAYDPETKVYHNIDDTVGFIWECVPLYFSDREIARTLEGLFRLAIPEGSVMQFILYADPYIKPVLEKHKALKTRNEQTLLRTVNSYAGFLENGTKGLERLNGIPVRTFRLFVTLKIPEREIAGQNLSLLCSSVQDFLKGACLNPSLMRPEELIGTLARLFNDGIENIPYDETIPIRKQVIMAETRIRNEWDRLLMGQKTVRVITPKSCAKESSPMAANVVTGDIWGLRSDSNQILSPFFITYNIVFESMKSMIHKKCSLTLQQQGMGSLAPALIKKKDEFLWAVDSIDNGDNFFKVIPVVTLVGWDDKDSMDSMVRAKRLWEQQGYVMQEDKGLVPILFISSLPFGLYNVKKNVEDLDRHFIMPASAITEMLPIQADYCGSSSDRNSAPHLLFIGRKGQLASLDFFDSRANNFNAFVAAGSGGGKSFFINYLVMNYYGGNTINRIIDIGGSYKKGCSMFKGRFLEFNEESKICINPFSTVIDVEKDIAVISAIVCQMIYSASSAEPSETEVSLVKAAVRWAYEKEGTDATTDTVYYYLQTYPQHAEDAGIASLTDIARLLAFNMQDFTSKGPYKKWFIGKSTMDISSDEFVVLELEHLKPKKELFKVVTLQVLNGVTQDLYLSDRSRKRMVVFDEAWQFLQEGGFLKDVIEEGYRRARKYGGSFSTVTQSVLDTKLFGPIGDIIKNNSAFKIYLESGDFEKARAEKALDCKDFQMEILKSVKKNGSKYSEMYLETPFGSGVARLVVDAFSSYTYNSDSGVNARLEGYYRELGSYEKAIERMMAESS